MIYYFNPGHEVAILNGSPYYMAPSNIVKMQEDLAFLPAWYAETDGLVFVSTQNDESFHKNLISVFGRIPSPVTPEEIAQHSNESLCLWGVSQQTLHFWEEIKEKHILNLSIPQWNELYTKLNSREFGTACLIRIVEQIPSIPSWLIPQYYSSVEDIDNLLHDSNDRYLAKAPFSSSGRGLLWLPQNELTRTEKQILHGIIKKQRKVSIERVLDKKLDFAMEFFSDGDSNVSFEGYSLFYTNSKGGYTGNFIGSQQEIEDKISSFVNTKELELIKDTLITILRQEVSSFYKGCIGVDMMVYEYKDIYLIHPCLEINMRYNMGYLAACFSNKYLHPNSRGIFRLEFRAKNGVVLEMHNEMQKQHPSVFSDHKLAKGYLSLCPVNETSNYWAYVVLK